MYNNTKIVDVYAVPKKKGIPRQTHCGSLGPDESQPLSAARKTSPSAVMPTYVYSDSEITDPDDAQSPKYCNPDSPSSLQDNALNGFPHTVPPVHRKSTQSMRVPQQQQQQQQQQQELQTMNHGRQSCQSEGSEDGDTSYLDRNPYITPADPTVYNDSSFISTASGGADALSSSPPVLPMRQSEGIKIRGNRFQRFDSGVEDCESERGSSMNKSMSFSSQGSTCYPRLSTHYEQHYEDIDQYNRARQEQRQRESTDKMKLGSPPSPTNEIRPLPRVDIAGVVQSDSDDALNALGTVSMAEIVSPPVTNGSPMTSNSTYSPHTYTPFNGQTVQRTENPKKRAHSGRTCCALVFLLLLIFAMSAAALALSIYMFINEDDPTVVYTQKVVQSPSGTQNNSGNIEEMFEELRNELDQLKQENVLLKQHLESYQENITSKLQPLKDDVSKLQKVQRNTTTQFYTQLQDLQGEVANISLTPGPQGPAGIADFSHCRFLSTGSAGSSTIMTTSYQPSLDVLIDSFVIFAYCTVKDGTYTTLEERKVNGYYQYRCLCHRGDSMQNSLCFLNHWTCPRRTS